MQIGVTALVIYSVLCGWRLCRAYINKKSNQHMIIEFLYSVTMIYLLSTGSGWFLFLVALNLGTLTIVALLARIFLTPPESDDFFEDREFKFWLLILGRLILHVSLWMCVVNY
jgi:small-conductance mechanosensitive channel